MNSTKKDTLYLTLRTYTTMVKHCAIKYDNVRPIFYPWESLKRCKLGNCKALPEMEGVFVFILIKLEKT
ncbi:hypothetical protein HZS_7660 [Henneguya salminicola]|nr:hypothetical protein HZS_7660 [Henneguya salminicola]